MDKLYLLSLLLIYFGFYQFSMPTLVIRDPQLIKTLTITDFDKFMDRTDLIPPESDPFWKKLISSRAGSDWKELRRTLAPAFSSQGIREAYLLVDSCSRIRVNNLLDKQGSFEFDAKDFFKRYTNDVAAMYMFGVDCNSIKETSNEFYLMAEYSFAFKGLKSFKFFGYSLSPFLMNLFRVTIFDEKTQNYYTKIIKDTIEHRDKFNIEKKDYLGCMMKAEKQNRLALEDMAVQAMGLFFGSYETLAIALSNMSYELACNPKIQEKLLEEVDMLWVNYKGDFSYDCLNEAVYLQMVILETLRLRSPTLILSRCCIKGYTIEPVLPGEKPLYLDPGLDITIPVYSLLKDPKLYPNPEVFDPERFSDENKHKIDKSIVLAFGIGPRMCLGERLAMVQIKSIMLHLLGHYKFVITEKTGIPFTISSSDILLTNEKGYWLKMEKRKRKV